MKYLKRINETVVKIDGESKEYRNQNLPHKGEDISTDGKISIFQQDWFEKILPDNLTIISNQNIKKLNKDLSISDLGSNKKYVFDKNECTIDNDMVQFSYYYDSMRKNRGEIIDGEPSMLEFDIHFVKNTRGIKLIVNITYGDQPISEFTIESPNKINITHYNGFNSKYDKDTHWGFTDVSIHHLVNFFNSFSHGIKINSDDLSFIDEHTDTYKHDIHDNKHLYTDESDLIDFENSVKESLNKIDIFLIINNSKPPLYKYFPKVAKYLRFKNISYKVANTSKEVIKYNSNYNIIGAISTGSDFSIKNPKSPNEYKTSETALSILKCPILAMCYGFQSMAKFYGQNISGGELNCDLFNLTDYDDNHFLFHGIDLSQQKVSFCFHDYPVNVPNGFENIAMLGDIISGISNQSLERYGLLFHPEEIHETYTILDNFLNHCQNLVNNVEIVESYSQFIKRLKKS